jgi:hypothetical protein
MVWVHYPVAGLAWLEVFGPEMRVTVHTGEDIVFVTAVVIMIHGMRR